MEHWLTVKGHPNYEVSNLGNVRHKYTGKLLVPRGHTSNGSLRVYMDGGKHYVHRIVANTFLDIDETKSIGHRDDNHSNNELSNLVVLGESEYEPRHARVRKNVTPCINCIHRGEYDICENRPDNFFCGLGES